MTARERSLGRIAEWLLGSDRGGEDSLASVEASADSEDVRAVEEAVAELAHAAAPMVPSDSLRGTLLSSLDPLRPFEGLVERTAVFFDLEAARVRELLAAVDRVRADDGGWDDRSISGIHLYHLEGGPRVRAADCGLVYMEPGQRMTAHRHLGDEWSLVLQGSAVESESRDEWLPGDLVHRAAGSAHGFEATGDEPLVCAVVLYSGIEMAQGGSGS